MSEIKFNADEGQLIRTIQDAVGVDVIDVPDDKYVSRPVDFAPRRSLVDTLKIASLTGLADYVNKNIDLKTRAGNLIFIHVAGPTSVYLCNSVHTPIDRRFNPVTVIADVPQLQFDRFIPREDMMIMLQSRFEDTDSKAALLASLGNIVADEELQQEDDGVTQRVTTQTGVRRQEVSIQNPVWLKPFRTFTEVDQPASPFVVRIRDYGGSIDVALFEADGGSWRNDARYLIKEFLNFQINNPENPGEEVPIIA